MANKIFTFFSETKTELKKVTWPSKDELIGATVLVLIVTAFLAAFAGICDFLFSLLIRFLIR